VNRPVVPRCPYCHEDVASRHASCARCDAALHAECALELGRCAACAGPIRAVESLAAPGWTRLCAGDDAVAFAAIDSREPPPHEGPNPEPVSLRLDVLRRTVDPRGVLAGDAVLWVPAPTLLGALELTLVQERLTRGLFGVRNHPAPVRTVRLLGSGSPPGWRRLFRQRSLGIYAPGHYRARFRLPTSDLPPTADAPGASEQLRYRLTLRLERPGGAFDVGLEVVLRPAAQPACARVG
jgi:hypothetical protein